MPKRHMIVDFNLDPYGPSDPYPKHIITSFAYEGWYPRL